MTEINKVKEKLKNTLSETDVMEMTRNFNDVRELMTYYQCAIMEVETKFRVLNERFKLSIERNPIDSITSRLKSLDSIVQKLERKKLPMTVEAIEQNLFDVAGIRIICSFVDDIYMQSGRHKTCARQGLYKKSQGERLPQSASYSGGADISGKRKTQR